VKDLAVVGRQAWVIRRCGRVLLGSVVTVERSVLAVSGLPTELVDGTLWYLVGDQRRA
jgi:hypothetical protein